MAKQTKEELELLVEELQAKATTDAQAIQELKDELKEVTERATTLAADLSDANDELETLRNQTTSQAEKITTLQQRVHDLETRSPEDGPEKIEESEEDQPGKYILKDNRLYIPPFGMVEKNGKKPLSDEQVQALFDFCKKESGWSKDKVVQKYLIALF